MLCIGFFSDGGGDGDDVGGGGDGGGDDDDGDGDGSDNNEDFCSSSQQLQLEWGWDVDDVPLHDRRAHARVRAAHGTRRAEHDFHNIWFALWTPSMDTRADRPQESARWVGHVTRHRPLPPLPSTCARETWGRGVVGFRKPTRSCSAYRVYTIMKSHGRRHLDSRPGKVMEFRKKIFRSWKSHKEAKCWNGLLYTKIFGQKNWLSSPVLNFRGLGITLKVVKKSSKFCPCFCVNPGLISAWGS